MPRKRRKRIATDGAPDIPYPSVRVEWIDCVSDSGWATDKEFDKMKLARPVNEGWLYSKDDKSVKLFASYDKDENEIMVIVNDVPRFKKFNVRRFISYSMKDLKLNLNELSEYCLKFKQRHKNNHASKHGAGSLHRSIMILTYGDLVKQTPVLVEDIKSRKEYRKEENSLFSKIKVQIFG